MNKSKKLAPVIKPGTVIDYLTVGPQLDMIYEDQELYSCMCTCGASLALSAEKLLNGKLQSCNWRANDPNNPHVTGLTPGDIWMQIEDYHVSLLRAMLDEGGKDICIDDAFLEKHNVNFRPLDPRQEITDIVHFGLIRKTKSGAWSVAAKGKKWLSGALRIRRGILLAHDTKYSKGWFDCFTISADEAARKENQ